MECRAGPPDHYTGSALKAMAGSIGQSWQLGLDLGNDLAERLNRLLAFAGSHSLSHCAKQNHAENRQR